MGTNRKLAPKGGRSPLLGKRKRVQAQGNTSERKETEKRAADDSLSDLESSLDQPRRRKKTKPSAESSNRPETRVTTKARQSRKGIKNAIVPTPKINVDNNDDDDDDPAHVPGRRVAAFNRRSDQPSQGSNLGQGKSRTVGVTTTKAMLETAANGVPSSRLASGSTSQRSTNSAAKDDADDLLQKAKDELIFVRRGWKWCWDLSNARAKEIESLKKELNEVKTELDDQTERNSALEASLQGKDEKIQDLREEMGRLQTLLLQNGLQF